MGGAGGIIGSKYKMGGDEGSVGLLLPPTLNVVSATITLPSISSPVSTSLLLLVFILSLSCSYGNIYAGENDERQDKVFCLFYEGKKIAVVSYSFTDRGRSNFNVRLAIVNFDEWWKNK